MNNICMKAYAFLHIVVCAHVCVYIDMYVHFFGCALCRYRHACVVCVVHWQCLDFALKEWEEDQRPGGANQLLRAFEGGAHKLGTT